MFHRVGDVGFFPVDAGFFQRTIKHLACGPDKGEAGEVLLVARLFADQHDLCMWRALAEHGLGGVSPQVAGAAVGGLLVQGREAGC